MVYNCCVPGCENKYKSIKFHVFPMNQELYLRWIHAINRQDLLQFPKETVRKKYRICDDHFDKSQKHVNPRKRSNLKLNSVPNITYDVEIVESRSTLFQDILHEEAIVKEREVPPLSIINGIDDEILVSDILRECTLPFVCTSDNMYEPEQHRTQKDIHTVVNVMNSEIALLENSLCGNTPPRSTSDEDNRYRLPEIRNVRRKKRSLLSTVNVNSRDKLTPKCLRWYNLSKKFSRSVKRLQFKNITMKKRIKAAKKAVVSCDLLGSKINNTTLQFLKSQVKLQKRTKHGYRFSLDDKLLALTFYKSSAKCYRLLQKSFVLPSKKTLMNLLNRVPFHVGINEPILNSLREVTKKMSRLDCYCIVMFDEILIQAALSYNRSYDCIDGFENLGDMKELKFADHAMVFMARGIRKKWKQPISFYFVDSGMKATTIKKYLKMTIEHLQQINLNVVATVCDQKSPNLTAISLLKQETRSAALRRNEEDKLFGFSVGGKEIIPLYDAPHLLKGIWNNLLNKNAKFSWKKENQIASWQHVIQLYELDNGDFDMRMCNKLNDGHVYENKMKKMKVNIAAQVFSQRVSSMMRGLVKHGSNLPTSAEDTADFLLFFDKLFDSVNGTLLRPNSGKELRCVVCDNSAHHKFWEEALTVLKTIKYISSNGEEKTVPSVSNWIALIRGCQALWKNLYKDGFTFISCRNFNQDPIECFFGNIRSHGVQNTNPTCESFISSFKSIVLNNFTSAHSPGANCEEDTSEALDCLKAFLYKSDVSIPQNNAVLHNTIPENEFEFTLVDDYKVLQTHAYISGYIVKKIKKKIGNCSVCIQQLITSNHESYDMINFREYHPGMLTQPNTKFVSLFSACNQLMHHFIPRLCLENKLRVTLKNVIINYIPNDFLCEHHDLFNIFIKAFVKFYVFTWIKNINKILNGSDTRILDDEVKELALKYNKVYKSKAKKIKDLKKLL